MSLKVAYEGAGVTVPDGLVAHSTGAVAASWAVLGL